jgi:hypothetical protein
MWKPMTFSALLAIDSNPAGVDGSAAGADSIAFNGERWNLDSKEGAGWSEMQDF